MPLLFALALPVAALDYGFGTAGSMPAARADTVSDTETQAVTIAATAFLNTLGADQRAKLLFPFTPQKTATVARFARNSPGGGFVGGPGGDHRGPDGGPGGRPGPGDRPGMGPPGGFVGEKYGAAVWSNYPVSDVPRPGLRLSSLTASQRAAAMHLFQVLLSPKGYRKILDIMGSDQALSEAGQPFASGRDVYTIGIFGTTGAGAPWMIQFGGHHLGLNVVIAGTSGVMTPTLTGAQPSVYTENGKIVRVLAGENDKAFALLDALDDTQRKQAILNYAIGDLVLGPGHDGETIVPEGLKASAMTTQQRALLLDVISEWAGIVNDIYARPRMEEIKAGLNDTYFAWSGPTTHEPGRNGSSYYRIQGPKLVIEFSPQGVGGDPTMHVHTIYRDPTNDYGHALTLP
ncbi:DUF3500 domain-containing protein [Gluconacetobacter tumulisoli]|uniref:DUF3500 domain-containing protein n=2 Tax=Gluconacetobacter tumulisoli TaxID=1286189 RepID=A0A7W4KA13_9PROT|nr:DUF3500 domain-containing protein [Gluconacetobacter tumulisoli]